MMRDLFYCASCSRYRPIEKLATVKKTHKVCQICADAMLKNRLKDKPAKHCTDRQLDQFADYVVNNESIHR